MISREPPGSPLGMMLNAVSTAPFPFEVCITPTDTGGHRRCWKVTGLHPETGASVSQTYELAGHEQGDYLDLFQVLCASDGRIISGAGCLPERRRNGAWVHSRH